jgi:hypothetical protein
MVLHWEIQRDTNLLKHAERKHWFSTKCQLLDFNMELWWGSRWVSQMDTIGREDEPEDAEWI